MAKQQSLSCSVYISEWPVKHTASDTPRQANLLGTPHRTNPPTLKSPVIQKDMCLLIITSHTHCGHNTYRYGKCSGNTAYVQCPEKRTELGTFDGKCPACDRWAALARRMWEERTAWVHEKGVAAQAERERRRSTLWQDHHPLADRTQSAPEPLQQRPSWCEW